MTIVRGILKDSDRQLIILSYCKWNVYFFLRRREIAMEPERPTNESAFHNPIQAPPGINSDAFAFIDIGVRGR